MIQAAGAGAQVSMTIAYEDKEQPPYYMGISSEVLKEKPGVAVEMVKALEGKIPGLTIKLLRVPWARCLSGLGANTYDGIFNASYSASRLDLGWYPTVDGTHTGQPDESKRITTMSYSLYTLRGESLSWNGSKFLGVNGNLGAPLGYSIVDDLKRLEIVPVEVSGNPNLLGMLILRRLQGVVMQDVTADALIKAAPEAYGSVVKIHPPIVSKPYYLMLSHRFVSLHPELAQRIWEAIEELREGEFDRMVRKYLE